MESIAAGALVPVRIGAIEERRLWLELWVAGIPEPQGSARAFYNKKLARPIITSDNKDLRAWRAAVTATAQASWAAAEHFEPLLGAAGVELRFVFPRLASHFNAKGEVRGSAPSAHIVRPDLDKLCRGVVDALADAGILRNDAQVARLVASKAYGARPGANIQIWS